MTSHPLTWAQKILWAGHEMAPKSGHLNQAVEVRFGEAVDAARLFDAVTATLEDVDAFRLTFEFEGDDVRQRDGGGVPPCEQRTFETGEEARAWMQATAQAPFDVAQSVARIALIETPDQPAVLFLSLHHLVCDGAAVALFLRRVAERYASPEMTSANVPSYLELAGDFAEPKPDGDDGVAPDRPPLSLYGVAGGRGGFEKISLPISLKGERGAKLKRALGDQRFRLLTPLMSAQALLTTIVLAWLARVADAEELSIAMPQHNRTTPASKAAIGLFMEMLPLDIQLTRDESFTTLHGKVLEATRALMLAGGPGAARTALLRNRNVVLNIFSGMTCDFEGGPVDARIFPVERSEPGHDLNIEFADLTASGHFTGRMVFDAARFPSALRESALAHFLAVFDQALSDPDQHIAGFDMLTAEEDAARDAFNASGPVPAHAATVIDSFHQIDGGAPALRWSGDAQGMTFGELDARANQLAHGLIERRVTPGDRVAIHLPRSPETVIAILGVLKAGAAFVPVEYGLGDARRDSLVEDVAAVQVITDAGRVAAFQNAMTIDAANDMATTAPAVQVDPSLPAYVIYTSGSTGQPKGVVVGHRELAAYIATLRAAYPVADGLSYALFSAFGFDLTINSLFLPLVSGGEIVVYPEPETGPDLAVLDVFRDDAVDFARPTPSHLRLVLDAGIGPLSRISIMPLSGEAFPAPLAARALQQLGQHLTIINEYGPTEAVVGAMLHRYDQTTDTGPLVPLGRPAPGMDLSVRNVEGYHQPVGVPGEIAIGGRLAQAYFERPELTQKSFVSDRYDPLRRIYLTGDLGTFDPAGDLVYLGRRDTQVKFNGIRLELGEVEHLARAVNGVDQVVALMREDGDRQALDLYVSGDACAKTVADAVHRGLPPQIRIRAVVPIKDFPLSGNGKIARDRLPHPTGADMLRTPRERPLATDMERHLGKIWGEVLKRDDVFADDTFLELGGDSLSAVRIVHRARQSGLIFDVNDMFQAETLAELAKRVKTGSAHPSTTERARFQNVSDDARAKLADALKKALQ